MAGQSVYNSPDVAPAHVNVGGTSIWGFSTADGVTNFLGIPYGKIPSRFRRSQLVHLETLGPDVVDATAYGPSCPQPPTWTLDRNSRAYLYEGAQPSADPVASELDCLRLNIYTPAESTSADASKLPVLVWIHGGGFIGGDGSWQYGKCLHVSSCCLTDGGQYTDLEEKMATAWCNVRSARESPR